MTTLISGHVQRLHHHAAGRLGYRRRRLVMIVIPHVDHPSVKSPSPGVQLLAPVGVAAPAMYVPAAGNGLVQSTQALNPLANAFGFSTVLPSEHTAIAPTPTSTPMVGPCHFSPTLTR